ncbi:uncharacterized protein LOC131070942 isoform X2 [Cryptomeria japonica]|uniref:uncharacterized protein LOC131070942 isoform X2 n=1 Tax=Cryptomeria japonica TaxID=3369 RepID=UPI0027DA5D37|nr:uncharacterized protein LOC131070942 isoform X2 [Cryptomeria japonica]
MAVDVSFEDCKKSLMDNMNDSKMLAVSSLNSSSFTSHLCEEGDWHQCDSPLSPPSVEDYDFSDLEDAEVLEVKGKDKAGRRILRIVGKYFPANLVSGQRLQKYVNHKISNEIPEGPFCVVYIHTSVPKGNNYPGFSTLRLIYQELPPAFKERLEVVYFLHPDFQSWLLFATFGWFFLSGGLYGKLKCVNRLEFLWGHIRKGQIEIPDFVHDHDDQLDDRPLMDYGVEANPFYVYEVTLAKQDGHHEV